MAEFDSPEGLLAAANKAREAGFKRFNAYSPFPIEGLAEAIGFHENLLGWIVLTGGVIGGVGGFLLQYFTATTVYPMNIGGRPLNSWPSFIPVTFECTILLAALSAVLGMLALNKLPMPYHPVFNVKRFALASRNLFFLCIEARDPKYDSQQTREFLESLTSHEVYDVDH
ncbi:MAG: DUF3341 domain-containing protein [Acidobacteria bacterium]|nr:DUF3341 domain-containing protein [Acidobacteriota bacterium]